MDISYNQIDDECAKFIGDFLKTNNVTLWSFYRFMIFVLIVQTLTVLLLDRNIGSEGVQCLSDALLYNKVLFIH